MWKNFLKIMMPYGRTVRFYGNQSRFFSKNDIKSKVTGAGQNDRIYICLKTEVCPMFYLKYLLACLKSCIFGVGLQEDPKCFSRSFNYMYAYAYT